jgi:glyoxylase-like metal-dependent hydrolase (beta-lactamase superfamily II)
MEIAPGIYSIFQKKGIFVHAFLLDDGNGLTLIDTLYSTDAAEILAEINRINKKITDIKRIVLTHAHRAHLGGLAALKAASRAPIFCHPWEVDIVAGDRGPQCMSLMLMRPYRLWTYQVASRFGHPPPCRVEQTVNDGDQVGPLRVVSAPGHTPGHLAFYWPDQRALFAGDAVVNYPVFEAGWPAFTLNRKQNLASVKRLSGLDVEVLGVGHGNPIATAAGEHLRALVEGANKGDGTK